MRRRADGRRRVWSGNRLQQVRQFSGSIRFPDIEPWLLPAKSLECGVLAVCSRDNHLHVRPQSVAIPPRPPGRSFQAGSDPTEPRRSPARWPETDLTPARPSLASTTEKPRLRSIFETARRSASSSSTTRTVPSTLPASPAEACTRRSRVSRAGWLVQGSRTSKREPWPGALTTLIVPPWSRMIPCTAASPMPRPVNLVVKNGSKILAWISSVMPQPVSLTVNRT